MRTSTKSSRVKRPADATGKVFELLVKARWPHMTRHSRPPPELRKFKDFKQGRRLIHQRNAVKLAVIPKLLEWARKEGKYELLCQIRFELGKVPSKKLQPFRDQVAEYPPLDPLSMTVDDSDASEEMEEDEENETATASPAHSSEDSDMGIVAASPANSYFDECFSDISSLGGGDVDDLTFGPPEDSPICAFQFTTLEPMRTQDGLTISLLPDLSLSAL